MEESKTKFDIVLMSTLITAGVMLDFASVVGLVAFAIPIIGMVFLLPIVVTCLIFMFVVLSVFFFKHVFAPLIWIVNLTGLLLGIILPVKTVTILVTMFLANHPTIEKAAEIAAEAALAVATGGVSAAAEGAVAGAEVAGEAAIAGAEEATESVAGGALPNDKGEKEEEAGTGVSPQEDVFREPREPGEKLEELFEKTPQDKAPSGRRRDKTGPLYEEDEPG